MNEPDSIAPPPAIAPDLVQRIVEAALLASHQPLTLVQLRGLFPLDAPAPDGSVEAALQALQADSATRGIELVEVASGWRYQVRAEVNTWVSRLWTERQVRYTRATLETLALIAYRQPITRGEIEQVRGVATNSNIIKALEEREWIRVVGHRDMPGRPELLGTTKTFLDYFGLKRLDDLPPLSELKDFGALEPELQLAPAAPAEAGLALGDLTAGNPTTQAEPDTAAAPDDTPVSAAATPLQDAAVAAGPDASPDTTPPEPPSGHDGHDPDNDNALAADGDSDRSTA